MRISTDFLRRLVRARERIEQAERDARLLALEAVAEGVPQTHVADSLGVTRMTVWRWHHEAHHAVKAK